MDSSGDKMSLDTAMNELGESIARAREALAKSTSTLEAVHREVLPQNPLPRDADGFLGGAWPRIVNDGELCSCPHGTWL